MFHTILYLSTFALADIPPEPPPGKHFVKHALQVNGMEGHQGVSLILYDKDSKGKKIDSYRIFNSTSKNQLMLTNARSIRGPNYGTPELWAIPSKTLDTWLAKTSASIEQQRKDCNNGIGCLHISRFRPHITAPDIGIPCKLNIKPVHSAPAGGPTRILETVVVKKISATTCVLQKQKPKAWKGSQEFNIDEVSGNCNHSPHLPYWFLSLGALCVIRRKTDITAQL